MEKLAELIKTGDFKAFSKSFKELQPSQADKLFVIADPKYHRLWEHTLLSYSCLYGRQKFVAFLKDQGSSLEGTQRIGKGFPLAIAVLHNHFSLADWIQKHTAFDCSVENSWPLRLAISYENSKAAKYSLENGAKPEPLLSSEILLEMAASTGSLELMECLLTSYSIKDRGAVFHQAVKREQFHLIEWMLDHRVEPNMSLLQELAKTRQYRLAAKAVALGGRLEWLQPSDRERVSSCLLGSKIAKRKVL